MNYDYENTVSIYDEGTWKSMGDAYSEVSKLIKNTIISGIGICPPFAASVHKEGSKGTIKISFFNEFDTRKLSKEKILAIVKAMNASGDYEVALKDMDEQNFEVIYKKI